MLPHSAHAAVVFFMAITTFILSILIVFSSPFVAGIWFVKSQFQNQQVTMGVFGVCNDARCSRLGAGYEVSAFANRAVTGPMVMWSVVAGLSFVGLLLSVPPLVSRDVPAVKPVVNPTVYRAIMGPIVAIAFTAWVITVVGWSIVVRAVNLQGGSAQLGPAVWMGLACVIAALIALILGVPTGHTSYPPHELPPVMPSLDRVRAERAGDSHPPRDGYWHYKHTTRVVEE